MPDSKLDWSTQLLVLRNMTERFGTLHEAQVLQLRLWPFTVDPTLQDNRAEVDLEKYQVSFFWKGSTLDHTKKDYQKRLNVLDENVKFLLGKKYQIAINLDGTQIYHTALNYVKSAKPTNKRRIGNKKRKQRAKPKKKR